MNKRIPIIFGLIFVGIAVWLLITSIPSIRLFIDRLDDIGYDLELRARVFTHHIKPASPVAIIDIDDASLKAVGRWPWPRDKVADLINQLQKQGAAVIAFDIFFSEKENNIDETLLTELGKRNLLNPATKTLLQQNIGLFDQDAVLAKSLAANQSVLALGFLPHKQTQNILPPPLLTLSPEDQKQLNIITAKGYISNIPILQNAAKNGGFINIFSDNDGIIRHAPLLIRYGNDVYPSLALQAVLTFLGTSAQLITPSYDRVKQLEGIQLGAHVIPTDEQGQVFIPFVGKSYTFPYYSAANVLQDNVPKDALLGKIVFVGTSATGLGDLHATAIQNPFPGVEIQATLVNGILQDAFSYKPEWTYGANLVLTVLLGFIAAFSFPYFGPRILGLVIFIMPPGLFFLNKLIWEDTGLILSFLMPVMLILFLSIFNIIYGYLFESRRREQLKNMFGQYVPAKHIDEMLKTSGADFGLRGEDREMSVLFADIRSFTTISEGLPAAELVDMLNTFFTPMTEIIFNHRGTIDKYVGDLIMAFWGAPLKDKSHTRHAIQSALEMQAKVKQMREEIAARHWPEINIGIGINSGTMSVGDMGSRYRRNYTVLGDAVNLASRVEGLTKFYGVDIIVTESAQLNQTKFVFRKLDRVRVKGKKAGISIYEVICTQAELTDELKQELELYHKALDDYFEQRFDDAFVLMTQLQQRYPDKKIYALYLARIKEFKEHPLPSDWDGVYVHMTK